MTEAGGPRPRIQIVEDDERISRLVRLALSDEPYECFHCSNGNEGLSILSQTEPHLIILDYLLPDMAGSEFLTVARNKGYVGPVLYTTALGKDEDHVQALVAAEGENSVLLKPFDPDELVRRVAILLGSSEA